VTGADRLDRLDAQRSPDRECACCDRDRDPEHGGPEVHVVLERCAVFGKRQERFEEVPEGVAHEEPDAESGDRAEDGDLDADEHGADRELWPRDTERHPDADLAALSLHDPVDQVERGKRCGEQHECRQCIPEALVVVDVLVQHSNGVGVVAGRDGGADAETGDRFAEFGCHGVPVGAVDEHDHCVVDHRVVPADVLRRGQGEIQDRQFSGSEDRSLGAFVEEVLGGDPQTRVGDRAVAGDGNRSGGRQSVLVGELDLENGVAIGRVIRGCGAVADPDVVDRLSRPERHPDESGGDQHRFPLADRLRVHLAVDDQPFGGGPDRVGTVDRLDRAEELPLLGERPGAERDPEVVHLQCREAGVVGLPPPFRGAAQACVHPGPDRQNERDRDDRDPVRAEVAPRPAQPPSEPTARRT
jgi:hypothetical protein